VIRAEVAPHGVAFDGANIWVTKASTESEWVARHLESLGHDVIVADPNYGAMYARRSRRVKTDRRDAAALADACLHGNYCPADRRSARQRVVQSMLKVRRELTDSRTRAILIARAITRAEGFRIRSGRTETFLDRLRALELPASMTATLMLSRAVPQRALLLRRTLLWREEGHPRERE
jgi:transposase